MKSLFAKITGFVCLISLAGIWITPSLFRAEDQAGKVQTDQMTKKMKKRIRKQFQEPPASSTLALPVHSEREVADPHHDAKDEVMTQDGVGSHSNMNKGG